MGSEKQINPLYIWLSDNDWNKLMFHTRTQVNAILNPLKCYGQDVFVEGAIDELMKLFDLFSQRIRGKDIPLIVIDEPKPRPTE